MLTLTIKGKGLEADLRLKWVKLDIREAKGFPQIIFLKTEKTVAVYASHL